MSIKNTISRSSLSRRAFLGGSTVAGATLLLGDVAHAQSFAAALQAGAVLGVPPMLTSHTFTSPRHTTHYIECGPSNGPLMIFLHGWPQIGLMWRAQMEAFAADGWHCVAPDMRGYGGSSAPAATNAYTVKEIVADMVEFHEHLGDRPAVWVGHDLGSPIAAQLTAIHPDRSRGLVLISVAYSPNGFALPNLVALVDRDLYPVDKYPYGQWDYIRYYQTNFEDTVRDFDADIPATLASVFRSGNPSTIGKVSPTAGVTKNGGRYGAAHRAPPTTPDPALWPAADFDVLVEAYRPHGFRPVNAWYLNDEANIAYAKTARKSGQIDKPVLFINGDWDPICDITRSALGDPMRQTCPDLTVTNLQGAHWLPLERKTEVVDAMRNWATSKNLKA